MTDELTEAQKIDLQERAAIRKGDSDMTWDEADALALEDLSDWFDQLVS